MTKEELDSLEYVKAVTRALGLPYEGVNRLDITWQFPGPVIVNVGYVKLATTDLLSVLPPAESVKVSQ